MDFITISLAPVTGADAERLADICVTAMRESLEAVGRFDPERARSRFLDTFTPECTRAIVLAGSIVGFVVVRVQTDHLLLDHLYLLPETQGRGVGAQVLEMVFAEADAANLPVRVGALKSSRSNAFYARYGFELVAVEEWDNYYVRKPNA